MKTNINKRDKQIVEALSILAEDALKKLNLYFANDPNNTGREYFRGRYNTIQEIIFEIEQNKI